MNYKSTVNSNVVIVTGGTRGIGKAISEDFLKHGSIVYALYEKNDIMAVEFYNLMKYKYLNFFNIIRADITDKEAIDKIIIEIIQKNSKIDVLVNNVGITRNKEFSEMSFVEWNTVVDVNFSSLYNITHPVVKCMKNNNFGRIINISSVNGHKGQSKESNYCSTKSAMYGFTKSLAQELASYDITVNTISPGYINTDLTATLDNSELDIIISRVPKKRLGTTYEVARIATFLASRDSGFITGTDISVNGGLYM
ncbi:SDR family oxidoreductase [Silvanigrella paludirubra]|uniref:SDR family oxidoreductase n=1 Tax=Silvanigrella paludirubra TaxID=2499159 RepID=A0A6N6VT28_9BACT|nr:3-oxoacyl-ACP reductase FabG [Silvanigrella paludirubra]KAB8038706.1 SDR family oxidoreductase [Silvanigrella paludirubra]